MEGGGRQRLALSAKTTLLWSYNNHKEKKQFGTEEKKWTDQWNKKKLGDGFK